MTITISDYKECWYVPGSLHIVDLIHPETGLTLHFKKTAEDVLEGSPGAQRLPFEDAVAQITEIEAKTYVKPVSECTEADYWYALQVLPPVGWKTRKGVESFKMSERTCGEITGIFAQCGHRYFTLSDSIRLPAEEIADRVAAYIAANPVSNPVQVFSR